MSSKSTAIVDNLLKANFSLSFFEKIKLAFTCHCSRSIDEDAIETVQCSLLSKESCSLLEQTTDDDCHKLGISSNTQTELKNSQQINLMVDSSTKTALVDLQFGERLANFLDMCIDAFDETTLCYKEVVLFDSQALLDTATQIQHDLNWDGIGGLSSAE